MAHIVPGAIWQPIDVGNRAARQKGRGFIGHVAVSSALNLVPWGTPATRAADWHFYLPKDPQPQGRFFQYIDLDVQCWSSAAGNATCPAFESQGGLGTADEVNAEPWTDNQLEAAAIILAHLNQTEGVPLQDMGNSLPTSRGFGVHRYGIDPWRVPGGEVWSSSRGKLCPGDAKVAQVPVIVSRAAELVGGSPSPAPQPAPQPIPVTPGRFAWNLPAGNYYGNVAGPARSHGGYYASERPYVQNIQQWLTYHGCVPGIGDWHSGWADGRWEAPTDAAMSTWHARFYPQPYPAQCWADDYDRLARP